MNGPLKVGDMVLILNARTERLIGCYGTVVTIHLKGHQYTHALTYELITTDTVSYDVEVPGEKYKVNAKRSWLLKITPPPASVDIEQNEELTA